MSDTEVLVSKDRDQDQKLAAGIQNCHNYGSIKPKADPGLNKASHGTREAPVLPPPYSTAPGGAAISTQPRARAHGFEPEDKPNNFMEFSVCNCVVSCICCAWIPLLVSIIPISFSNAVNPAWDRGDTQTARFLSRCALIWNIVAVVCFIGSLIAAGVLVYIQLKNNMEQPTTVKPYLIP